MQSFYSFIFCTKAIPLPASLPYSGVRGYRPRQYSIDGHIVFFSHACCRRWSCSRMPAYTFRRTKEKGRLFLVTFPSKNSSWLHRKNQRSIFCRTKLFTKVYCCWWYTQMITHDFSIPLLLPWYHWSFQSGWLHSQIGFLHATSF